MSGVAVEPDTRSFGRALQAAISDKRRDAEGQSTFYFDADVLVAAFYPLRDFDDFVAQWERDKHGSARDASHRWMRDSLAQLTPRDSLRVAVRSLWGAGYACQAHVLWPHVCELEHAREQEWRDPLIRQLRRDLEHTCFERLGQFIPEKIGPDYANAARHFLDALDENMTIREYILLEAALLNGWEARRAYLGSSLVLDGEHGPDPADLVYDPSVRPLAKAMVDHVNQQEGYWSRMLAFTKSAGMRSRNAVADAVALVGLRDLCGRSPAGTRIRFYTHTAAIHVALDQHREWWQRVARDASPVDPDPVLDCGVMDDLNGPLRSSRYMFLRSTIPALSFAGRTAHPRFAPLGSLTLQDLSEFCDHLRASIEMPGRKGTSRPESRRFTHQIAGLLSDDAMASTFANLWLNDRNLVLSKAVHAAANLPAVQSGLRAIQGVSARNPLEIEESIKHRSERIRRNSTGLKVWADELLSFWRSSVQAQLDRPSDLDVLQDSGVGRWLFWLQQDSYHEVASGVKEAVSSDGWNDVAWYSAQDMGRGRLIQAIIADAVTARAELPRLSARHWSGANRLMGLAAELLDLKLASFGRARDRTFAAAIDEISRHLNELRKDADSKDRQGRNACAWAAVSLAWVSYYWIHYDLKNRPGGASPDVPEVLDPEVHRMTKLGLACVDFAKGRLDADARRLSLVEAIEALLWVCPGGHSDERRRPEADDDRVDWKRNKYLAESSAWSGFYEEVRRRLLGGRPADDADRKALRELARSSVERINHATQLSLEEYWAEHSKWMMQFAEEQSLALESGAGLGRIV